MKKVALYSGELKCKTMFFAFEEEMKEQFITGIEVVNFLDYYRQFHSEKTYALLTKALQKVKKARMNVVI